MYVERIGSSLAGSLALITMVSIEFLTFREYVEKCTLVLRNCFVIQVHSPISLRVTIRRVPGIHLSD